MVKSVFRGEMERMEDLRLLRRYAQDGCAASFEAVVRRHIGWVYSSSVRQVGDPELAQDVTQAVFILLARRAATLSDQTVLTGWLFNTLRFTAREARRKEARRRKHESRAARAPGARTADTLAADDGIDDQAWEAMAPLLDDAVTALSESDRQAVLLRFYEGRDFAEIAELLGVNEGAARKRVSRAVQRLGRYFKKRGITLPLAALAATLLARSSDAAPFGLSESIISSVDGGATLTPLTAALLRRTTRHLLRAKRRLATAIAAGMGLLGVALTALVIASACDSTPDLVPLESDTPIAWSTRAIPTPAPEPVVLPAQPIRARLIIQTTPPATQPPAAPKSLVSAPADATWWVRQWFDPTHAPTPDIQARRAAEDDATNKAASANAIDPATGLPRANPSAPNPTDVVESYAQMGGGGGPTVTANTRGGAPVGGELNGATAGSTSHSTGGPDAGPVALSAAGPGSAIVQVVAASNSSATAIAVTLTPVPSLTVDLARANSSGELSFYYPLRRPSPLWVANRYQAGGDIAITGMFLSNTFLIQYDADRNTRVSFIDAPTGDGKLLQVAFNDDSGETQTVTIDPRHPDATELAQLPPAVLDSISLVVPVITPTGIAYDAIPLTATAVPEPTTPLLFTLALLTLTKRRNRN